jgi:hypothetical protein
VLALSQSFFKGFSLSYRCALGLNAMHVFQHLVALDDRIVQLSSPLNSRASILNVISIVSRSPKQNAPIGYTFALSHFVFLFLLFQMWSTWSPSFHVVISILECHLAPSLGVYQPISVPHLEPKVSTLGFINYPKPN